MCRITPGLVRAANLSGSKSVDFCGVDERFDRDLLALRVARAARWPVIQRLDTKARHHRSIRVPKNRGMLGCRSEYALMATFDGLHQWMLFRNLGARDRHERFRFEAVVRIFVSQIE